MSALVLDAGPLIAIDRGDRDVAVLLRRAAELRYELVVPAGALAQAWRDGRKQARLARFLASPGVDVEPLDGKRARAAGQLCGVSGTSDVVDASVVLAGKARRCAVVTSDPDDIRHLDPLAEIVSV